MVVIDDGEYRSLQLLAWLKKNDKIPVALFLTHEHFDHCAGINALVCNYDFQLLTTVECAELIGDDKRNLSRYMVEIFPPFQVKSPVVIIDDLQEVDINGLLFRVIKVPGHSKGSTCFQLGEFLFSGDTLLENKVPVKLPGGNKLDLELSLNKLQELLGSSLRVYPGHGGFFLYDFI